MANEVSLVISGDATSLDKAIADATKQVQSMDTSIGTAGTHAQDSAPHLDAVAEKSDAIASKSSQAFGAMGALGSGLVLAGLGSSGLATGLGAVALGFDALSGIGDTVTLLKESGIATKAWTLAQGAFNLVMSANPLILVTLAIIALVAIIVVIATKTDWFQKIWHGAWGAITGAAKATWNWLKDNWPYVLGILTGPIGLAVVWVIKHWDTVTDFFRKVPGALKSALSTVTNIFSAPFRAAFNLVSDAWNNTIGKLHFNIPSWVPGIGGKGFDVPNLPHFDQGGIVPGAPGVPVFAVVHGGETVVPAGRSPRTVTVAAGDGVTAAVFAAIREQIASVYGGDVVIALGGAR